MSIFATAHIFNASFAMESYATVFEAQGARNHLEAIASEIGPRFRGLPFNEKRIALERRQNCMPGAIEIEGSDLVPFHSGETLNWDVRIDTRLLATRVLVRDDFRAPAQPDYATRLADTPSDPRWKATLSTGLDVG